LKTKEKTLGSIRKKVSSEEEAKKEKQRHLVKSLG
jgi:hypothetical protein